MDATYLLNLLLISGLGVGAYYALAKASERSASAVLSDLSGTHSRSQKLTGDPRGRVHSSREFSLEDPLAHYGLFTAAERAAHKRREFITPFIFAAFVLFIRLIAVPEAFGGHIASIIGALGFGYLYQRRKSAKLQHAYIRSLEFYLPVVMERLVMAAQAGLDILPAIGIVCDCSLSKRADQERDPVSRLLSFAQQLTEAGMGFESALQAIAEKVECSALRHAFIHLARTHVEGGELVGPLRELSDSTQLYFQESVEEEIAKMPVKATAPLLCTFAGLMVFFLTAPLMQIVEFVAGAKPIGF